MQFTEEIIFQLISFSGSARSYVFEALKNAKEGNYTKSEENLAAAKKELLEAHKIQTNLIQEEAAGNSMEVKLLMVHAQDHLMTSILAKDLIFQMVEMQREINVLKEKLEEGAK
ncbi:PTS lactose/cellobiose transporter subunit IIA [Desnuesiella massiliensis]|uniref:PTS lactose/cellobiose transporter subunit IIA n=1 Tax=Desnuesiella massiliensis TaxID=1650662 RepID=UPI0006E44B76|nr:PTS lactose/cellobiose transporter subunit IIA [Desnuesiella massiliensis]